MISPGFLLFYLSLSLTLAGLAIFSQSVSGVAATLNQASRHLTLLRAATVPYVTVPLSRPGPYTNTHTKYKDGDNLLKHTLWYECVCVYMTVCWSTLTAFLVRMFVCSVSTIVNIVTHFALADAAAISTLELIGRTGRYRTY